MTQGRNDTGKKNLRAKGRPRHFAISTFHFSLGAGVTPAEGSVKPTAGFTLDEVARPSLLILDAARLTMRSRGRLQ